MRIDILACGTMKDSAQKTLMDTYLRRLSWPCAVREIVIKNAASLPPEILKTKEAEAFLEALPKDAYVIALDERGQNLATLPLAKKIEQLQTGGISRIAFLIGGADGLDETIRAKADLKLSFGALTWPHMLVRIMLAEQVYRVQQCIAGHPYHREG